ncbi:MAG: cyclase family protein, partial [Rhodospirillaceae bacterium]|nr:cyclase family protein [Rhodospirillaceae bacterium]
MQIPTKIIDLSMALDNDTIVDPEIMRPKIQYVTQAENAEAMASFFPGMNAV